MDSQKETIAIIVVNYNTSDLTKDCLSSLFKINAQDFDYRIIVVDNGSLEPFTLPKKWGKQPVEVIRTEANLGFTGGNNLGISHAVKQYNPEYFLLLNSDTEVDPDFLQQLYQPLAANDLAGISSSKIYFYPGMEFHHDDYQDDERGKVIWYAGATIDWPNLAAFHRGVDEVDRGQFDQFGKLEPLDPEFDIHQTDFATGCSMLIKREVIEKVGILDKKYFLYLEDVDFSLRTKRFGYKILLCPNSIVWHKNAGSSEGAGSEIHLYYQTRNRLIFFFKYASSRIRLTLIRFALAKLIKGSVVERKAVRDFLLGRVGKQPVI